MTKPDGLDQSWGTADPTAAKKAGIKVVSMYLSWDPSKNITAAKVKAYHNVGIASLINWESQAGAPLLGSAQGRKDATEAVRQLKQLIHDVGYAPHDRVVIYFSCDRDVSSSQLSTIGSYYKAAGAICHAAGFGVGAYGEADLMDYLAKNKITDAEWQTYAWSGGRTSAAADFMQYSNGQKLGGASVDFDRIIHAADLGAWWPRGMSPKPANPPKEADVTKSPDGTVQSWTHRSASNLLRAIWTGNNFGYYTHKRFPNAVNGKGGLSKLFSRVDDLEARVKRLEARK